MENLDLTAPLGGIPDADKLTGDEALIIQAKIWKLLAVQTERYTLGDSTSVPIETAQELLASICYTIREYLNKKNESLKILLTGDIDKIFKLGIKVVEAKIETGKGLWKASCLSAPDIESISYRDTLQSIGSFFKRYDYRFFAHQVPCSIDYQLCQPVSEKYLGIEYINQYLQRIVIENSILQHFESSSIICVLRRYCPDYKELLVNLCDPVITNAIGLTLIGGDVLSLTPSNSERAQMTALFELLTEERARFALIEAAHKCCNALGIEDDGIRKYVMHSAIELYPRISAAMTHRNLNGIFI